MIERFLQILLFGIVAFAIFNVFFKPVLERVLPDDTGRMVTDAAIQQLPTEDGSALQVVYTGQKSDWDRSREPLEASRVRLRFLTTDGERVEVPLAERELEMGEMVRVPIPEGAVQYSIYYEGEGGRYVLSGPYLLE